MCYLRFLDWDMPGYRRKNSRQVGRCRDRRLRCGRHFGRNGLRVKNLLLGTSTWGAGELQDDWYDGLEKLKGADLSGKTIALFGCGDCESYGDTFCGALAEIYEGLKGSGAKFVGQVPVDGYTFGDSAAVVDGMFLGLALDDINEDDKTDGRIDAWVEEIKCSL